MAQMQSILSADLAGKVMQRLLPAEKVKQSHEALSTVIDHGLIATARHAWKWQRTWRTSGPALSWRTPAMEMTGGLQLIVSVAHEKVRYEHHPLVANLFTRTRRLKPGKWDWVSAKRSLSDLIERTRQEFNAAKPLLDDREGLYQRVEAMKLTEQEIAAAEYAGAQEKHPLDYQQMTRDDVTFWMRWLTGIRKGG